MPVVLTAPLIILGQVVAAAFAAGLNLYLTVAVVALSSRFGWIPALPPGLRGLENSIVISSALVLYLVEFVLDKVPTVDSLWDAVHTLIRPLSAALLTAMALRAAPIELRIGAAVLGGLVALGAHAAKAGFRIVLNMKPSKWRSGSMSIVEDVCAAGLAVCALQFPVAAVSVAAAALSAAILLAPRSFRTGLFGARALRARVRAFFGKRGWHPVRDLPIGLQPLVDPAQVGRAEPRAARAALKGVPGVGAYRTGWVVLNCDRATFVYRSLFGRRVLHLPPLGQVEVSSGPWTDAVHFKVNGSRCTLFLMKDGPAPDVAVADLATVP
jgi:uncharacterized protein DUF4126